jgi:RHS repeat-associated protein
MTTRELAGTGLSTFMYNRAYTANNHYGTVTYYSDLTGTNKVGQNLYTWNGSGDLTNIKFKDGSGTVLQQATYTFDSAHRATAENLNGANTSYTYDSTNQVTAAGASNYSFDSNGNRNMTGYTTGTGNQTTNDGTFTYTYDNNGNVSTKSKGSGLEKWFYDYDNLNHLTSVRKTSNGTTNTLTVTYSYDAFGNRVQEDRWQTGGSVVTTKHVYDGQQVLFDLTSGNAIQTRYVWGDQANEILVRQDGSGTTNWLQTDRLGSVIGVTDGTGAVLGTVTYAAFGDILTETSSTTTGGIAWQGTILDRDTGIVKMFRRDELLAIGKFLQYDPILFQAGDPNLSRMVGNNVTNATDPSGLQIFLRSPTISQFRDPYTLQKDPFKEQLERALAAVQQTARTGVPKTKVDDISGPDVTAWFARDIVDQIEHRAKMMSKNIDRTPNTPPRVRQWPDLEDFKEQAAHYLAPKWMDFGSPGEGKGVNTVVVANRVLRKNILGNIELGVISDLMPPDMPAVMGNNPIEFAYLGMLFTNADDVSTYWTKHYHNENYGDFKGVVRADNLAAFGVGTAISTDLRTSAAATMKEIQAQVKEGKFKGLTDKQQDVLTQAVATSLKGLFSDDKALQQSVNTYNKLLSKRLGSGDLTIPIEALFFIPEYGGFNTDSLNPSPVPYLEKQTSRYAVAFFLLLP